MLITLSDADPSPLYQQIVAQVRAAIACGDLQPGDRLPSLMSLSESLGISHLTVKRAYDDLCANGLTITRRGRGLFVRDGAQVKRRTRQIDRAIVRVAEALRQLHAAGGSLAEAHSLVKEHWPEAGG